MLQEGLADEQKHDSTHKEDDGGIGTDIEGGDLGSDGGSDIGAHDNADGLAQIHQAGIDEADDHNIRRRRALDQHGYGNAHQHGNDPVFCGVLQNDLKTFTAGVTQSCRHDGHTVEEQTDAAHK